MEQIVVLVDEQDRTVGRCEKLEAHRKGLLHRAFSVFLYDRSRGAYLMQRRAPGKYHSGGKWSNSCCSHPLEGESWEQAIGRCLEAELGLKMDIRVGETIFPMGRFHYYAPFAENAEHEMDHVFFLPVEEMEDGRICTNPEETDAVRWVKGSEILSWMEERPGELSAWFAPAFRLADGGRI